MRVRWTKPAADDLISISDYTEEHFGANLANQTANSIYDAAQSLTIFPRRGRVGSEVRTRVADTRTSLRHDLRGPRQLRRKPARSAQRPKPAVDRRHDSYSASIRSDAFIAAMWMKEFQSRAKIQQANAPAGNAAKAAGGAGAFASS
jgi:plasmid stabilization system protein ParE